MSNYVNPYAGSYPAAVKPLCSYIAELTAESFSNVRSIDGVLCAVQSFLDEYDPLRAVAIVSSFNPPESLRNGCLFSAYFYNEYAAAFFDMINDFVSAAYRMHASGALIALLVPCFINDVFDNIDDAVEESVQYVPHASELIDESEVY